MPAQDTNFYNKKCLDLGVRTIDLSTPLVMGILNITPDSFYDGGTNITLDLIEKKVRKMINEGVDIVDVGGYSTRPNAGEVDKNEELQRVIPIIKFLKNLFPKIVLSIDTFRSEVATNAVGEGASMINDISGGTMDDKMFNSVARLNVPYVLTHIKGNPKNMQKKPSYQNVVNEVSAYFKERIEKLEKLGFKKIIIDPGFGFGKTLEHNYELLKNLSSFKIFKYPILVGVSRKSMINKVIESSPENSLNGTTSIHTITLLNGANILRAHDIKEAKEVIKIVNYYRTINHL